MSRISPGYIFLHKLLLNFNFSCSVLSQKDKRFYASFFLDYE